MTAPLTSDNSHLSEPKTTSSGSREINFTEARPPGALTQMGREIDFTALVAEYLQAAISSNTRRAYGADIEHYVAWGGTLPSEPETVAAYLAAHASTLAIATLKRRVASISAVHEAKGLPNPTHSKLVKATLRGLQRLHGAPQRQSSPLLVEDLTRIVAMLGNSSLDMRDRAVLMLGFAGGFRRSELVGLNRSDLEFVSQGMVVTLTRSKTDQTGQGRKIGIPFARGRFCPVQAIMAWLTLLGDGAGEAVFRPVSRHGQIEQTRLSPDAVSTIVKRAVERIGLDADRYSGHSLRAGFATSAAMHGISTIAIRRQTGHNSDAMLARYVRSGELFEGNASGMLL